MTNHTMTDPRHAFPLLIEQAMEQNDRAQKLLARVGEILEPAETANIKESIHHLMTLCASYKTLLEGIAVLADEFDLPF